MVRLGVAKIAAGRGTLLKLAAAAMFALAASPANAEMQVGVYGGWNGSFDSDIHLTQPGGTNMTTIFELVRGAMAVAYPNPNGARATFSRPG